MKRIILTIMVLFSFTGCVERRLTVRTQPSNATVILNDEKVGQSPVTVRFNWYGDYKVRITKPGYETLDTHKELQAPLHDKFPFDFFAQLLYPETIVDEYTWKFELKERTDPNTGELIEQAIKMKEQMN